MSTWGRPGAAPSSLSAPAHAPNATAGPSRRGGSRSLTAPAMATRTMEAHPHPDSLFDGTTLALAYPDLLAVLARDHPAAVAAAARTLEAGAASLRRLDPGSAFTSPGAFLARGWIARTHPADVEGVHESQAREAAGRYLSGRVTELRQRSRDGLVFGYEPANRVRGVAPPLVRVRRVEGGRRLAVDLLDPEDGSASHVATPAPAPVRWTAGERRPHGS